MWKLLEHKSLQILLMLILVFALFIAMVEVKYSFDGYTKSPKLHADKKVMFVNTGLERIIDIDGNITDRPISIH